MSNSRPIWTGFFSTREAAVEACKTDGTLWSNPRWLMRQGGISGEGAYIDSWQSLPRPTTLPLLTSSRALGTVVDFGGSSGWVYQRCLDLGARLEKYVVVEVPPVVAQFAPTAPERVVYVTAEDSHKCFDTSVDILYSNATLQYLNSLDEFLSLIISSRPRTILIDELLWTRNHDDWFSVQTNSDRLMVVRFVSFARLKDDLQRLGYRLGWSQGTLAADTRMAMPDMSHLPEELRINARLSACFLAC